ncbi:hypothetical protein L2E82_35181 [Cichorium intybus]|uniref:Uncharacterized protein n=1 Tax=Cichorium intybus TaxID=13427 RepID=A0ACB9BND5_CICIN|nr:hypothetical protein L2E82_35181 [Cichorium intybus]
MATNEAPTTKQAALHPVYTVTNIQNKVRILDGTKVTYSSWVKLFKLHARGYKVLDHMDGTPAPAKADATCDTWAEIDAIVLQWIYGTLSDDLLVRVLDTDTTAYETWKRIRDIFLNNKGSRATALEHEFTNLTLTACSSMDEYCQRLKELADQLTDVENPVTEQRLVLQLVRGLPNEYDTVASFINQSSPSWDTARSMLQLEQHRQSARQNQPSQAALVTAPPDRPPPAYRDGGQRSNGRGRGRNTQPGRSSRGGRNTNQGRGRTNPAGYPPAYPPWTWWAPPPCPYPTAGNTWPTSWPSGPRSSAQQAPQQAEAHIFHQQHHQAPPTPDSAQPTSAFDALNPTDLGHAFQSMQLNHPGQSWYMDTGASSHLTADSGKIQTPLSSSSIQSIFVGNGTSIPIQGSGNATHTIPNKTFSLRNILYTPHIIKNLLSVRKFTRDNFVSVEFDPWGFFVKELKTGKMLSRHNSSGDLYPLTKPTHQIACFASFSPDVWHNRLGHPGTPVLDFLRSHFFITCHKHKSASVCHSCQVSKHKRLPFYTSNSFTFAPFDIIHCDLWTSPIISKAGYKYYMVLIDNFTQYVWVYPLKFKSETFTNFTKFHQLILTQFNRKIKTFQCDLGGEFDNLEFKTFASTHGLTFRFSCPQTSPQNGKAERMIRRLNDIMRTLLTHAHLPTHFWVEALHIASYLHNILPTKLLNFHTPTFALYLRHPTYDHLRVFGCACYPNIAATQPHKLTNRSTRCIFLGYPQNFHGYRCLDLSSGKVLLSRHVVFDELTFPFTDPQPPNSYRFLDDEPFPAAAFDNPPPTPPPYPTPTPPPPSPTPLHNPSSTPTINTPRQPQHHPPPPTQQHPYLPNATT